MRAFVGEPQPQPTAIPADVPTAQGRILVSYHTKGLFGRPSFEMSVISKHVLLNMFSENP